MSETYNFQTGSVVTSQTKQLTTFKLNSDQFGIDVMRVQEVTKACHITKVPLAPNYVKGLINLRGQIVTAIGLNELLGLEKKSSAENSMMVVCKTDTNLLCLIVDSIGDVVEIPNSQFEDSPDTLTIQVKKFMNGVYKTSFGIVSVIDIDKLSSEINTNLELKD